MIKLFGKGLGVFNDVTDVGSNEVGIIRDTRAKLLGNLNGNLKTTEGFGSTPSISGLGLTTTIQGNSGDIRRNSGGRSLPVKALGIVPQVFSAESGEAPFETFFHDFDLQAFPFYNFWTPDETKNDITERGNRDLSDIPRFIKLTWNPAPDLQDPEEKLKPRRADIRDIKPVVFSGEIDKPIVFANKGIQFLPEHLQKVGFKKIKGILANGYMAPGVLEAIVELYFSNTSEAKSINSANKLLHIDEDSFLSNPNTTGIAVHEMKSQIHQLVNFSREMRDVSSELIDVKSELYDGKSSATKTTTNGGKIKIATSNPDSPSLSITANTATNSNKNQSDQLTDLASSVNQGNSEVAESMQVKVKFFNPAVDGILRQEKINMMKTPEHVETAAAIASNISKLDILSKTSIQTKKIDRKIPSVPSPKFKPFAYLGYVIEKYVRLSSGIFSLVEEIDVPAVEADYYIDTKIKYGEVYRYRIKAIFMWTRHELFTFRSGNKFQNSRFGTQTTKLAPYQSSFFATEWGHKWAYGCCIDDQPPAPPDELTVRPDSNRKRIVVTFKLPFNPQKDISKMRLLRKLKDEFGKDLTDWHVVKESSSASINEADIHFAPENVIYFENDVDFFQNTKQKIVYAAQTLTRHGEHSTLSEQLAVRLNSEHFTKGEFPVEFVSSPGVRYEYTGAFSTIPITRTKTSVVMKPEPTHLGKSPGKTSIKVSGRDTLGSSLLTDTDYIARILSLDTGETKDIFFSSVFVNMPDREDPAKIDSFTYYNLASVKNSDKYFKDSETSGTKNLRSLMTDSKENAEDINPQDRLLPGERF